jgi:AcrR family transcriptional regulator
LSRASIAQAALDIIDEAGLDALTMRSLAERCCVQGASLYNHIASKDDLLDAVFELLNRRIDLSPLQAADWRGGIAAYARAYRAVYRRHPNIIAIVARRPVASRDALAGYDALLTALQKAGCTCAEAAAASAALDYLVLGSALETFTTGFDRTPADYRPDFPALADALEESEADITDLGTLDDRGFEMGIAMLLDGLAHRIALRRG